MSFIQNIERYKSQFNVKVQNTLLLNKFKNYSLIKQLRIDYTFTELYTYVQYRN